MPAAGEKFQCFFARKMAEKRFGNEGQYQRQFFKEFKNWDLMI